MNNCTVLQNCEYNDHVTQLATVCQLFMCSLSSGTSSKLILSGTVICTVPYPLCGKLFVREHDVRFERVVMVRGCEILSLIFCTLGIYSSEGDITPKR